MTGQHADYRLAETTLREIIADAEQRLDELEQRARPTAS
jgi:hypothetical protein